MPSDSSFNTQPPEGGWHRARCRQQKHRSFNTQPPEGGWHLGLKAPAVYSWFQHTAARRRLGKLLRYQGALQEVSTHSRPKAAGKLLRYQGALQEVSTHSRPKAAGYFRRPFVIKKQVSTHSRPKAAGASLKSLATSGFASLISLNSQEKQKCEYNTAFSVIPTFAIS